YGIRLMVDGKFWGHLGMFFDKRQFSMSNEEQKALETFGHFVEMMISRHNNNELLKTERDKALAAEKAKDLFFATVSHDIRTPLNSILGFAQLLSQENCAPEDQKTYLNNILFSGNVLKELIDDVLVLSSLTQGHINLVIAPHNFAKVCHDVIQSFSLMAEKRNLVLKADIEPMPTLEFDLQRIRQILTNYIGNALKFTPSGSITLHAAFTQSTKTQGTLMFEVIDTGIGIAPEDLPRLAQPFVQLGDVEQRQMGTGLGLTICKDLLMLMGGCQQIESAGVGQGSTFRGVLPGIKYHKTTVPQEESEQEVLPTTLPPAICNLNVLLADDVPLNLNVLKAILKNLGIKNIYTATDGLKAFEIIQQHPIDVVLTDAGMPNVDGRQLAEMIRGNEKYRKIPIYVITGDVNYNKTPGVSQLFNEVLFKPITMEMLCKLFLRIPRQAIPSTE
ncbi:MAG: response regulator, partial [Victivallales bacterium]|nr:response regulator [Victivallales bacterium]